MKKFTIASLIGALIIFIWSFLSWTMLPIHLHTFHYTPKQDTVVNVLNKSLPSTGVYMTPMADNRNVGLFDSKYREADENMMKTMVGKPSAIIFYTASNGPMNPMQFVIGLLLDLFAVVFAIVLFVMAKDKLNTFFMRWWMFIVIGVLISLNTYLIEWNWMYYPWHYIKGMVLDVLVEWGLCGAWLAWYLGRS